MNAKILIINRDTEYRKEEEDDVSGDHIKVVYLDDCEALKENLLEYNLILYAFRHSPDDVKSLSKAVRKCGRRGNVYAVCYPRCGGATNLQDGIDIGFMMGKTGATGYIISPLNYEKIKPLLEQIVNQGVEK